MQTPNTSRALTRHLLLVASAMACSGLGTVSLLHGLSVISASWLQPNPDVPSPMFTLMGAILLLAALLFASRLTELPARLVSLSGYTVFGLSLVLAHWLIFLSRGGRCVLSAYGGSMAMNHMLCAGVFGTMLVLVDLTVLAIIAAKLRRGSNRAVR